MAGNNYCVQLKSIMYILAPNTYPYSVAQLRADNPQVSFPATLSDAVLAEFNVFPVEPVPAPAVDTKTHKAVELPPAKQGGKWVQEWAVVALTQQEQEQARETARAARQRAFQKEADPLFFKWQRGEGTQEEWRAKVEEIKRRYAK